MKFRFIGAIIFLNFATMHLEAEPDELDILLGTRLSNASIISSKQIKIPNYHRTYNPSLITYKDGYLLSFRYVSRFPKTIEGHRADASFVGLARLDKKLRVYEESVQLLNISSYAPHFSLTVEDGRLVQVGDKTYLFFNDLPSSQSDGFAMYFVEIIEGSDGFITKEPAKLLKYHLAMEIEKNWSPFVSKGRLYTIYSDQPRIILEVDLHTGDCCEIGRSEFRVQWDLGRIRGGTPADAVGEELLTFFHSSFPVKTLKGRAYVMGAYTFDKEPPFSIRSITHRPLGTLLDYTEDNSIKVVFPAGIVVQDHEILISWGKGDKQIWITVFDREKLLSSMQPLKVDN
jgi:predicted GH43/DUF377 family glycosyl hydrolase